MHAHYCANRPGLTREALDAALLAVDDDMAVVLGLQHESAEVAEVVVSERDHLAGRRRDLGAAVVLIRVVVVAVAVVIVRLLDVGVLPLPGMAPIAVAGRNSLNSRRCATYLFPLGTMSRFGLAAMRIPRSSTHRPMLMSVASSAASVRSG